MLFLLTLLVTFLVLALIRSVSLHVVLSFSLILFVRKLILLNFQNLKTMKSKQNLWRIIIGAVSAALGYVLNSLGL